jgi:inner membrane protein involved in colicin E2 resistance
MKKFLFVIIIPLLMIECKKEDYSPYSYSNESTIFSDSKTTQFRELVVIIEPYIMVGNEKRYIVTDTIKNVNIKISNKLWGIYNSFGIDTSIFIKQKTTNFYSTNIVTKYSIIAPYQTSSDTLRTAGEYSDLLNNYLTLEPGNYICQIESFEIKQIDGTVKKIKPFIVVPVEVKDNSRSALVGEFEVQINNN